MLSFECWMLSYWRLTPAMKNFGILNLLLYIVTNYRELSVNLPMNFHHSTLSIRKDSVS